MADDDLIALDKSKSSNPKPIPKPGSLKPAGSSKKNSKDYKSLTGRQKAAIFLISLGPDVSSEIMKHLREDAEIVGRCGKAAYTADSPQAEKAEQSE